MNLFFLFDFYFVLFLCFVGGALDVIGRVLAEDVLQGSRPCRGECLRPEMCLQTFVVLALAIFGLHEEAFA